MPIGLENRCLITSLRKFEGTYREKKPRFALTASPDNFRKRGSWSNLVDVDTSSVTISVLNLSPTKRKTGLLALADVEIIIDGISMTIHGVQVVADEQKTAVRLPRHRALDGTLQASVSVPEEVKVPLAEAVMAAGIEAKLLIQRSITDVSR